MQLVFEQPGQRDWILCGMETHVCVLQTALDLLQRGQNVFVAADAVCSRTKANWRTGLDLMRQAGAVIGSTEIFAFGLLGAAGSETFKKISRLVK
jgi:nicotinamidase-related amidase